MRFLVAAMVLLGACGGQGLPNSEPQCVWHLLQPAITSDTDEQPGAATCDLQQFALHGVALEVRRDASMSVGDCHAVGRVVESDATSWFVDVDACGVRGMVGVNVH